MRHGFIRAGAATPEIRVADCQFNRDSILQMMRQADEDQIHLLIFPELCLTGYTCGDLFLSRILLDGALQALADLVQASSQFQTVFAAGLPLAHGSALYNVAAVFQRGRLLGLVPKLHIPNYSEFYEARHFSPGPAAGQITLFGERVPFGSQIIFQCAENPDFQFAVEICEDLWVAQPVSSEHALAGALVIGNLSASDETVAKADYRRLLVDSQSARLISAYIYADAGIGESTTDLVFAGHNLISENGHLLAQSELFSSGIITADLDLQLLVQERRRQNTFVPVSSESYNIVTFSLPLQDVQLKRTVSAQPFVPAETRERASRCDEILQLQAHGLQKRLQHIGCPSAVLGLSGGLDSTLALLVTVQAFDNLQRNRQDIIGVTMPGFGTTDRTYQNTIALARQLGTTIREIPIRSAVTGHFADIGHDPEQHDITYENAQARERTQILMDLANQCQGIVVGTGDLSELALGWATYNGDHMSMYAVNSSIPKTLIRHLVQHAADKGPADLKSILDDILATPVSPELLPPNDNEITQQTEHIVGPYILHDFFMFYLVRYGFAPDKIERLARLAFAKNFSNQEIRRWLVVFLQRFFAQQFKRSCMPDGPKVGSVTLSPRGDWRMPSDAQVKLWLNNLDESV